MSNDFKITVNDILTSPNFRKSVLLAGGGGLSHTVEWVHILDSPIYSSLTGNEFILSTGHVFADSSDGVAFLRQLIDRHVSGLCIELVTYIKQIPEEMIRFADDHDFPLIVFKETVSFIDITRDLHTMIISRNSATFAQVEKFSQRIGAVLMSPHDIEDILLTVHDFLGVNLAYVPLNGRPVFIPTLPFNEQKKYLDFFKSLDGNGSTTGMDFFGRQKAAVCHQIEAFNQKWAEVYMFSLSSELKEFELLIFEKAIQAISQDLLRELFIKEKKSHEENKWIHDWCKGRLKENEITAKLDSNVNQLSLTGYAVCIIQFNVDPEHNRSLTEFLVPALSYARSITESEGFIFLGTYEENQIVIVILDHDLVDVWEKKISRIIDMLKLRRDSYPKGISLAIGVGKRVKQSSDVKRSYQTAEEAIEIQKRIGREEPLYDSLNIFRIISLVCKVGLLDEFVFDYLGPVIQYDQEHHADLLKTLQVYCDCNGSKQKTAEQLYIVRQTLYLRIQKLEELLGADFMTSEKRLAIEFALHAQNYSKAGCKQKHSGLL